MKMAVGSDSVQYITTSISDYLTKKGIEVCPCGALAGKEADYVDAAREVAEMVACGKADQGLLFCNTGTGVTIIANKIAGVRAALCVDTYAAEIARLANNANVLVLSMRLAGEMLARQIVDTWLASGPSTEARRMVFHRKTDEIDAVFRKRPD